VAEKTKAARKRIGERMKMKNTVKNHVKVLDPTDSVDEGRKPGLTSRRTGWWVCVYAFKVAKMSNCGVFVNHGPVKIKR
jgi:hypothetical protein